MDFGGTCLAGCSPTQILSLSYAINEISDIEIYNDCSCKYDLDNIEASYSIDGLCWSCYMKYNEMQYNTINLGTDFYIRFKVNGPITSVVLNGEQTYDYTTQLAEGFNFVSCDSSSTTSSNTFNPYANLDCAISLQQQLAETVSCMFGIPIYYFKLAPNTGSKDITFKEYALMDVEAVKQIKLIVVDGQMPSSKPEFGDFGLDWQTDWETEITKGSFATAFGIDAQPMEGDLIYIPMMKRMWMVNGSYEEKKDGLMWINTTFKVTLVKYQEKGSVDLKDTEELVNSFVKNKYDDLFGEDERGTLDSGTDSVDAPRYAENRLYPIYESDATRKYVTCDTVDIKENSIYYKGTLISDNKYEFLSQTPKSDIIYQKTYCGDEASISFILSPRVSAGYDGELIKIGNIIINIKQVPKKTHLWLNIDPKCHIEMSPQSTYLVILRWSKSMNLVDFNCYKYTYNQSIPIYKVQNQHYYFDIDNPSSTYNGKFNIEYIIADKSEVSLHNLEGNITNFKLFTCYNDNISELLQMYPTHQHLLINDTARRIVDLPGVKPT